MEFNVEEVALLRRMVQVSLNDSLQKRANNQRQINQEYLQVIYGKELLDAVNKIEDSGILVLRSIADKLNEEYRALTQSYK